MNHLEVKLGTVLQVVIYGKSFGRIPTKVVVKYRKDYFDFVNKFSNEMLGAVFKNCNNLGKCFLDIG